MVLAGLVWNDCIEGNVWPRAQQRQGQLIRKKWSSSLKLCLSDTNGDFSVKYVRLGLRE